MKIKVLTFLYISLLLGFAVGGSSCSDRRTYDHYESRPITGWERNDTATFRIPRQWEGDYSLDLGLRTTIKYPYKSICLILEGKVIPAGKHKDSETFQKEIVCRVVDDNGLLMGKRGISNSEILNHATNLSLNRGDSLFLTVRHIMSREQLPGISDVGVRLIKIILLSDKN